MQKKWIILTIIVLFFTIVGGASLYRVDETEQVLVLQFGELQRVVQEPGLHYKFPILENLVTYDKRVLNLDPAVMQITLLDQRRLNIDVFARYRITDPFLFYQKLRNELQGSRILSDEVTAKTREVLGQVTQTSLLTEERADIMVRIRDELVAVFQDYGLELVDVRLVRVDIPQEVLPSVYDRMRSEREREAAEARARGVELQRQITSAADREVRVLLANAEREAQTIRGHGDARAIEIISAVTARDSRFYSFYRSLEAYRQALGQDSTSFVLSPESEFFEFFQQIDLGALPAPDMSALENIQIPDLDTGLRQELNQDLDEEFNEELDEVVVPSGEAENIDVDESLSGSTP